MSIERTHPLLAIAAVQQRPTNESSAQGTRKTSGVTLQSSDAQVKLSEAQTKLVQPSSQDINIQKVQKLKEAIAQGTLKMNSGKIADALLKEAAENFQYDKK
ncbi:MULTISPECIES: flagellar biosynthesis anti-sigma factor FlgM [Photorhabdus]|uniref:Negative regulator of flagellin synthesis n=3 Tax=Photorhabdus luminescens TaxID=29488 RepID=A0A1G5QA63_PHOLU|nr:MULTISPECIES: flagellar biosynthesis anti-sigma factor FlgM [Photorhabdus]KMW75009.1 flagellar biosynthesis anti-sigma factor FlgM [Photorhabdus luminescens subsp. luminescens]MCA6219946.1 anti-sigma-28 factor FlgM [Photorhabdus antumapuensis]MCW7550757.1 flagellar biosynthesis anti-sigma factor FlgM [Photorhabdus aballayi]MCW7760417.1 flagellar biosynthesis anti-sigma factor FlgM [Photorhabdus luminescens subsp. venezuelensis]OWO84113.1 anti-sigma-28 factor FlgM [Photorhabdus luminescens]